jgi:hypothetical protein
MPRKKSFIKPETFTLAEAKTLFGADRQVTILMDPINKLAEAQHNEQWPEVLKQLVNNARRVQALFAFFGIK